MEEGAAHRAQHAAHGHRHARICLVCRKIPQPWQSLGGRRGQASRTRGEMSHTGREGLVVPASNSHAPDMGEEVGSEGWGHSRRPPGGGC